MVQPLVGTRSRAHPALSRQNIENSVCMKFSQPLEKDCKRDLRPGDYNMKWKSGSEGGPAPARSSKEPCLGQWCEVQKESSEQDDDQYQASAQPLQNLLS